jgi:hypothetical protein
MRYREHAAHRARERFGVELTDARIAEIEKIIKAGQAFLLARADERSIYIVELHQGTYPFVWDRLGKVLVTALPWSVTQKFPERMREYHRRKGKQLRQASLHREKRLKRRK